MRLEQIANRLQDIAILTGGKAITEDLGIKLENVQVGDLAQAKKSLSTAKPRPPSFTESKSGLRVLGRYNQWP